MKKNRFLKHNHYPQPDAIQKNETSILQSIGTVSVIEKQALYDACFILSDKCL
jgi:hypothetical protein